MNTTLLIDGNWLLMSRLFAVRSYFNVQNDDEEKQKGTAELEDLLCRSINLIINRYDGIVNNIVLVADGGSWRKDVEKPKFFDEVYKGNRIKDAEIDWTYVYQALEDILEMANSLGITACKAYGVEGDDWIQHWSRKLNKKGINCIIWSSDADLKQLVQVQGGAFTAWFNESQKGGLPGLVLHKDLDDTPLDDIDMFMQIDNSNKTLDDIRALAKAVTYIDPADIVEDKIICGDKGDNIKSIIRIEQKSKTYRVSEADWHKVKEELDIESLDDFFNKRDMICESIAKYGKYAKHYIDTKQAREMFDYNRIMVWLNDNVIPPEIQNKMNEVEYKEYDLSYIKSNYRMLCKHQPEKQSVESIFEGVEDLPF